MKNISSASLRGVKAVASDYIMFLETAECYLYSLMNENSQSRGFHLGPCRKYSCMLLLHFLVTFFILPRITPLFYNTTCKASSQIYISSLSFHLSLCPYRLLVHEYSCHSCGCLCQESTFNLTFFADMSLKTTLTLSLLFRICMLLKGKDRERQTKRQREKRSRCRCCHNASPLYVIFHKAILNPFWNKRKDGRKAGRKGRKGPGFYLAQSRPLKALRKWTSGKELCLTN